MTMGDTFQDFFVDEIPDTWGEYVLSDDYNTKWEGNRYTYEKPNSDKPDSDGGRRLYRITLWSESSAERRLTGEVYYEDDLGLNVSFDFRKMERFIKSEDGTEKYVPAPHWDSVKGALKALSDKLDDLVRRLS